MRATGSCALPRSRYQGKRKQCTANKRRSTRRSRLRIERLEDRVLFTATPSSEINKWALLSSHTGLCSCPICTGQGFDQAPAAEFDSSGTSQAPLSSLPQLHSNASAAAKLFLDFDGHFEAMWGFNSNVSTPAYSLDTDVTTFTDAELTLIHEIWARVAEDFAPFNIDVTTVDPGNQANGVVAVIAIGGSYTDWYGSSAGGVAYIGGFYNGASNVGYVFENNLSSNAKYVAEAASHEAGHLFGLQHQATWSGSTMTEAYSTGTGYWAPLMGVGYNATRSTWHNGATNAGPTAYQDDLAIVSGGSNAFGYRADDFGSTIGTASTLAVSGTSVNFSGRIGLANDFDVWSFTTTGGTVTFQLTGAQYGSNLDAVLELWNASGGVITSDAPSNSQGASISTSVAAGSYFLVARSVGDYGDVGQYTITGSLPSAVSEPEISLSVSGVAVADGGTISFGTTSPGTTVTRTVTVTNQGSATLTLSALNAAAMPTGFTLVSNLGSTSLNAGASTTFVVRLDAAATGNFSGTIQLANNDGNENPYDLVLSGSVTAPEIAIAISGSGVADGQTVDFGVTTVGQTVSRTFTVTNTGTATLTLTSLNAASLPAGFTLTSNLGSTSLAAGQSTTFSIRLDAASAGSYGGSIQLTSNDSDENPYDLVLTGTVSAPEIAVTLSGTDLTDGQTVNFGSTTVGQVVSRTFTVTNLGNTALTLTSLNAASMPAGFTLTSNLGSTSLAAGQSTTFSIRLDAAAAGSYSGAIQLANNDSNESPFDLALSGTVSAPEIAIAISGTSVADGQTVNFGSTAQGTSVSRTFTVTNAGNATLTLTALNPASLPAGFTLTSNLGSTSLAAGQSTTFVVRLDAAAVGAYSGSIQLTSNDSDESPYDLVLSGTVTAPEIAIAISGSGVADGQNVDFGSTTLGTTVSRTFTVTNSGTATLTLTSLNAASMPAGFTLTSNLGSTSLAAGQSTTFTVRLDASAAGSYSGAIQLTSNDSDESPYDLVLTGAVTAPEIAVAVSGTDLTDGQTVNFGATTVGQVVSRTFTVTNTGNTTLTLTTINAATLPAGYTLTANLGSTSLAAGQSTTFTVRLDAAAVGTFSGTIQLANNDANESPFDLALSGTVQAPEIRVTLGGANVTDGQLINFGGTVIGTTVTRTFTVVNDGTSTLTLTALNPTSLPAGFTLLSNLAATSLAPGQSTSFTIRFDAPSAGTFTGSIALVNNDGNENPFDLQLQAAASVAAPGEITVIVAGQTLSADALIDFGATLTGHTMERTIRIRNDGGSLLTLSALNPLNLPPGFSILQDLNSTALNPGETASFILRFDAQATGAYSGQISLASNDADGPFSFQVAGTAVDPITPLVRVLDNGDAGTAAVGSWARATNKGYAKDIHTASKGLGGKTYSWNFGDLPAGEYHVWATWTTASTNATNAPYTLLDGGTPLTTVAVNQKVAPSGLTVSGARFRHLGTVSVQSGLLTVRLSNAANNQVVADAIRIERVITVTAPTPEVVVSTAGYDVTCSTGQVRFGIVELGNPQSYTFTVANHGNGSLGLALNPASLPAGFSLVENLGSTYLTPGESTTFTVQFNADTAGAFGGTICVWTTDADESAFTFQVAGTAYDPNAPLVRVIDDGSVGNIRAGKWTRYTGRGYANDLYTATKGTGSIHSSWNFTDLPNGEYRVQASWRTSSTYATNAPYSLYNGGQLVSTVQVNQRVGPNDFWEGGSWENLGTVTVTGNLLTVRLTNAANGTVVADAIRIERIIPGGAALAASLPFTSPTIDESNPSTWLTTLFASQHHSLPDRLPLPAASPLATNVMDSNWAETVRQALTTGPLELEDRLLADVVDLLGQARSGQPTSDLFAADDLALTAVLQQLL